MLWMDPSILRNKEIDITWKTYIISEPILKKKTKKFLSISEIFIFPRKVHENVYTAIRNFSYFKQLLKYSRIICKITFYICKFFICKTFNALS